MDDVLGMVDETFGVACAVVYIAMTRIESGRRVYRQITWVRSTAHVGGMLKVELDWVAREVAGNETVAAATLLGHWRMLYLVDISKAVHDVSAKP